jgi:uncharacterized protein (UPF0297 family)
VTPRNLQILAQKWNIYDPTFNHGGVSFDMDYLVSDFVLDTMTDFSIWDVGCEEGGYPLSNDIINVVKSTQPGFVQNAAGTGNRTIELELDLVSEEIVKEPRIFTDIVIDGEAKAVVEFCVRFKVTTPGGGVEVNFLESLATLYVDLTDGFSIGNLIVSPKIVAEETANQEYEVDTFFCKPDGSPFTAEEASVPWLPASELRICVVPTQESLDEGVLMSAIETFYFFRIDEMGNTILQDAIVNRQAAGNGLTEGLTCDAGTHCIFTSLIKADFYKETFATDAPTAAFLAQKWSIDDPIFNHGGVSFDMDYLVSDFVLDTMTAYSIWDVGCEEGGYPLSNDIINVVMSTQPGFVQNPAGTGTRTIELDLDLVSDEIVQEPRIFTDIVIDGEAKAVVEFCVRFKLTTPGGGVEVNFLESIVTLYVDPTDGSILSPPTAQRRLYGEQQQPPLPSQHHFEERPQRSLQGGITVLGEGIATLRFPGSSQAPPSGRRGLGEPEQEYYYDEERADLQEEGAQGAEISFQFSVTDGEEPEPQLSSASTTSVLFAMLLFLAGALNAYLLV